MNEDTKPKVYEGTVKDVLQDTHNANLGSERGAWMIEESVRRNGVGRGVVVDKDNKLIGGNKTHDAISQLGIDKVIFVETTGNTLVVTKRMDLSLDADDGKARELAYADNRTSQTSVNWDPIVLAQDLSEKKVDVERYFREDELLKILNRDANATPSQMTEPPPGVQPPSRQPDQSIVTTCPACGYQLTTRA